MNKTEHYSLNQWELHDRVMMQDFNADNAKIDAALKIQADALAAEAQARANALAAETQARTAADSAEAAARQALAAELRPKAGVQLIASYTLPSQLSAAYTFSPNINWDSWLAVFITVELLIPPGSYSDLAFYVNDIAVGGLFSSSVGKPKEERNADTFMFTPVYDKRNWARVFPLTAYTFDAKSRLNLRFRDITTFKISSGAAIGAGTSYKIWGVR